MILPNPFLVRSEPAANPAKPEAPRVSDNSTTIFNKSLNVSTTDVNPSESTTLFTIFVQVLPSLFKAPVRLLADLLASSKAEPAPAL